MICQRCNCILVASEASPTASQHVGDDFCIIALLEWRREAELRLISYEELSTERAAQIRVLEDMIAMGGRP